MTPHPGTDAPRGTVHAQVRARPDPWCREFEEALDAAGIPIAAPHREAWAGALSRHPSVFVGVTHDGQPTFGCAAAVVALRSLPFHAVYHLVRFGNLPRVPELTAALRALIADAHARPRILRVELETFGGNAASFGAAREAAVAAGFSPRATTRRYARTLRLNLDPGLDAIMKAMHTTGRRHLRASHRRGAVARPLTDPAVAPQLGVLERETFARTGGRVVPVDWAAVLRLCGTCPRLARLVGLYAGGSEAPADLLGFALAVNHGDHVEYANAATTRRPGLKIAGGYPLMWSLIEWAHGLGADWFDFGGVSLGRRHSHDDALGGISDFKRAFGGTEVEVGADWVYHVRPWRSRIAQGVSRIARRSRRHGRSGAGHAVNSRTEPGAA